LQSSRGGSIGPDRSSRIRYSAALPDMPTPPSGPLPPPPSIFTDISASTVSLSARSSSRRYSKRVSNASMTSAHSTRSSGSRLSTLFAGRISQQPGARSSMPPPPRPIPSFAPPPIPRPDSADALHSSFAIADKRRSTASGNSSKLQGHQPLNNLPPLALPPSGPLPPIPATESETDLPSCTTERLRFNSALSAPLSSHSHDLKLPVAHPFGASGVTGSSFLEGSSPGSAKDALLASESAETQTIALSPPPRRSSRHYSPVPGLDLRTMQSREMTNGSNIRSSTVIL